MMSLWCQPCTLQLALKPNAEDDFDQQKETVAIRQVKYSEWAAPNFTSPEICRSNRPVKMYAMSYDTYFVIGVSYSY